MEEVIHPVIEAGKKLEAKRMEAREVSGDAIDMIMEEVGAHHDC